MAYDGYRVPKSGTQRSEKSFRNLANDPDVVGVELNNFGGFVRERSKLCIMVVTPEKLDDGLRRGHCPLKFLPTRKSSQPWKPKHCLA
jgi:hypothetical protein